MPELSFKVDGAEAVTHAVSPLLALKLRVTNSDPVEPIQSIILQCQVRIDPARRRYEPAEQQRLTDLFGEPPQWGRTLRSMLWTHVTTLVRPFIGDTVVDLHLPCTFDFNVAATKYFNGVADGDVPLSLLFSGTIFFANSEGLLQVAQVPWDKEATFRLPVRVWKEMMDHYYPNTAWLCLRRDIFDRLHEYKAGGKMPTWEQALETLLPGEREGGKT